MRKNVRILLDYGNLLWQRSFWREFRNNEIHLGRYGEGKLFTCSGSDGTSSDQQLSRKLKNGDLAETKPDVGRRETDRK